MTETDGLIAGVLLLFALFLYTFWPENSFASQKQKTRLDYLLERKEQLYENLRDLNFEYRAGKYPEEISFLSGAFSSMKLLSFWLRSITCSRYKTGITNRDKNDTDCGLKVTTRNELNSIECTLFCFEPFIWRRNGAGRDCDRNRDDKTTNKPAAGDAVTLLEPMSA